MHLFHEKHLSTYIKSCHKQLSLLDIPAIPAIPGIPEFHEATVLSGREKGLFALLPF
jgi:hypothetical protein